MINTKKINQPGPWHPKQAFYNVSTIWLLINLSIDHRKYFFGYRNARILYQPAATHLMNEVVNKTKVFHELHKAQQHKNLYVKNVNQVISPWDVNVEYT